ncbi:MAG TPA: hypothetical protein VKB59_01445, partial [Micromonosporaceae bacterium]|nr:hypothetical protein [Micromonosporaceae bacterium]
MGGGVGVPARRGSDGSATADGAGREAGANVTEGTETGVTETGVTEIDASDTGASELPAGAMDMTLRIASRHRCGQCGSAGAG